MNKRDKDVIWIGRYEVLEVMYVMHLLGIITYDEMIGMWEERYG